jgi:methylated-DNA-[protein]-cysteine S-methyltransferase
MTSKPPERLRLDRLTTPIGEALIVTDETGCLRAFDWADRETSMARLLRLHYGSMVPEPGAAPEGLKRLVCRYFDGDTDCLAAIEWRTAGTPFQRAVWTGLTTIAPGETLSYHIGSRGRARERIQSHQRDRAVSSRDRRQRLAYRLWRRYRTQAMVT